MLETSGRLAPDPSPDPRKAIREVTRTRRIVMPCSCVANEKRLHVEILRIRRIGNVFLYMWTSFCSSSDLFFGDSNDTDFSSRVHIIGLIFPQIFILLSYDGRKFAQKLVYSYEFEEAKINQSINQSIN